jgi:succinyl-diaminopimelate desuccinylase
LTELETLSEPERRLVEFARRLVGTPSLPGEERAVAELLVAELEELRYRDVEVDGAGNVTGVIGQGPARLMFNGHLDHVPPAGMVDPYDARLVDATRFGGRGLAIRGRGSCDMKANVAAGAHAAALLDPAELAGGTYVFTADVQEETDSPEGVQALLRRGVRAQYGISGESTGLAVHLGHRGKLQFDVVVSGRSSHASTPEAGLNAVYRAVPFLQALEQLPGRLRSDELFGRATVTVSGISAEPLEDVAVVPGACTIRVDRRYVPGETPESCEQELVDLVAAVSRREGVEAEVRLVNVYPLMSIAPDHELVEMGLAAVREVAGSGRVGTWRFGVNATFMSEAGIPTIGIGPGNEDYAHTADEHVPVGELLQASRIYASLIMRLCSR